MINVLAEKVKKTLEQQVDDAEQMLCLFLFLFLFLYLYHAVGERRKCGQLLCQMRRKMLILGGRWQGKKRIITMFIWKTDMRSGWWWQCRLGHAGHLNMMWSAMVNRTIQNLLVMFVLLCSCLGPVRSVGWTVVPAHDLDITILPANEKKGFLGHS